jgi:glucose-1-phosphate cytidylyltransferase
LFYFEAVSLKTVVLAGGLGTRLSEETEKIPKPLVEVGENPILWHIMKHYAHYGFNDFVIALGYKGDMIKKYYIDYLNLSQDIKIDFSTVQVDVRDKTIEDWTVELVDTGRDTMTGGRLKRLEDILSEGTFMLTYGDGVCDMDLAALLEHHRSQGRIGTVTAVRPPARFGGLVLDGDSVLEFTEKPQVGAGWINGGYMVFEPQVFDYLSDDSSILETDCMEALARDGQLTAWRHDGFWQCVDTLRELRLLKSLWEEGSPPWRIW